MYLSHFDAFLCKKKNSKHKQLSSYYKTVLDIFSVKAIY